MRVALAIAAMVAVPITAAAQQPPAPVPAPTSAPAPAPAPAPEPAGEPQPEAPQPNVDPAYGERPSQDVRDFPAPRGKDVIIVSYPERSKKNVYVLGGLAVGGVLAGALGLYFHLDSRSAIDEVGANKFTGETWSPAHQDTYDRARSSSIAAGVLYGLGGGLLLASAIAYIATEPKPETMVIHPHASPKPTALVAPTAGGAVVGGMWRF
ncbi:MAG TPA: hypothetical protein VIV11_20055 [Kofleriaceae bacterium]